jgi:glycine C-acetyltransferase
MKPASTRPDQASENFDLRQLLLHGRRMSLADRTQFFSEWVEQRMDKRQIQYRRVIRSAVDRTARVYDRATGQEQEMLMFGSNNYLGLANHPHVRARAKAAVERYGAGMGGPPLLNGTTALHEELEERLSAWKGKEATVLFASGYAANVGMLTALTSKRDTVITDALSHASTADGLKMAGVPALKFRHNDLAELDRLLTAAAANDGETFVGVEGVYSMSGDISPLDAVVPVAKRHDAVVLLDDAHGIGVLGGGRGTAHHFGVEDDVDVVMGTFSKAFGVVGGAVSASKPIVDYLRYCARSHMFSAALPPAVVGSVLGGLDLMERDASLSTRLLENVYYLGRRLRALGFEVDPRSGIVPLRVPLGMDIRDAARHFHDRDVFLNAIEFPAVPRDQQRFRISLTASHTREDLDRLVAVVEEVWALCGVPLGVPAGVPLAA